LGRQILKIDEVRRRRTHINPYEHTSALDGNIA
jgi:hypothetical protein